MSRRRVALGRFSTASDRARAADGPWLRTLPADPAGRVRRKGS